MTGKQKQTEAIELFNSLASWTERFQYLIDLGMQLPEMPQHLRVRDTQILSCTSRTYFLPTVQQGLIRIQGWSNAAIPAGIIAFIGELFDGSSIDQLRATDIDFHIRTNLIDNLTQQRRDGLLEMIERLKRIN